MRRVELTGEREVTAPGSVNARVRRLTGNAHVVVIQVAAGGVVARHPAGAPQLYAVVRGSGWVSGGEGEREPIAAGEAVVWEAGEEHESGSDGGMTALAVEAESFLYERGPSRPGHRRCRKAAVTRPLGERGIPAGKDRRAFSSQGSQECAEKGHAKEAEEEES